MKLRVFIMPLLLSLLCMGCGKKAADTREAQKTVFAMDTVMELKAYGENAENALSAAEKEITLLDNTLSRGKSGSEVYKINTEARAEVSAETAAIVGKALEISALTDGAFDITIAPVMDLWGFFTKEYHVPTEAELREALKKVDYKNVSVSEDTVTVKDGAQIDLGGIAKGYLSGRIMEIFEENGVKSGIVSLGGNVQALGRRPDGGRWRVAVQSPDDSGFIGTVEIENEAVITSGGYQRFFESDGRVYHHIIDPKTGISADSGLKSVTIVSENSAEADGLSTALYVMGLQKATEYWKTHGGFDAVLMTGDNKIYITEGLEDIWDSEYDYEIVKGH